MIFNRKLKFIRYLLIECENDKMHPSAFLSLLSEILHPEAKISTNAKYTVFDLKKKNNKHEHKCAKLLKIINILYTRFTVHQDNIYLYLNLKL